MDPTQARIAIADIEAAQQTMKDLLAPYLSLVPAAAQQQINAANAQLDDAVKRLQDMVAGG